jgi:hypothetical protein
VEQEQDPPLSLIKLNSVAEKEEGWLQVHATFHICVHITILDQVSHGDGRCCGSGMFIPDQDQDPKIYSSRISYPGSYVLCKKVVAKLGAYGFSRVVDPD